MKQTILMTIALACATAQGAWAESVTFNVRSWDDTNKQVVTTQTTKDATVLAGDPGEWMMIGSYDDLADHYYVVKGNVSYKTLNVYGKAHLILADGATLTCTGGIKVETKNSNARLFIYSQGDGDREGRLIVTNSYEDAAGIGSSSPEDQGPIEIHGGYLDVTGGQYAAGIGAGRCSSFTVAHAGTVTVYGGTVKAQGGTRGAGIGAGAGHSAGTTSIHYSNGADFSLYGGTVTATGGELAAGVGGGGGYQAVILPDITAYGGGGGKCHVYGGTLTAQGGRRGAGIGAGNKGSGDSGYNINSGEVHIEGGTVTATGGDYGAGIGGGCNCSGGTVNISGGTVTATGRVNGAGIGGGEDGKGGTVTITGGTVIAIAGGECKAREAKGGSAIGCGKGVSDKGDPTNFGSLSMPDNYRVTAGDAENDIERMFTAGERVAACTWRNYVKIEACNHTTQNGDAADVATYYTIDDDLNHTRHCRYCAVTTTENHSGETCVCGKATSYSFTVYQAGTDKNSYVVGATTTVGAGKKFLLPECTNVPEGYVFAGWEMNPAPEDENKWAAVLGDDFIQPQQAVEALAGMSNAKFYARFLYDLGYEVMWDESNPTTATTVYITHPDLTPTTLTTSGSSLTITYEAITDGDNNDIGMRYVARVNYTLNGFTYTYSSAKEIVNSLSLADNTSNETVVEDNNGREVTTVTLTGRTLYKDGSWNTLCLPFDADLSNDFSGAEIRTLSSTTFSGGTLTLNFTPATGEGAVTSIEAGKPYIIKWTSGSNFTPTFTNVTIKNIVDAVSTDNVTFTGFFSPVSLTANDKTVLYLGAGNKLYYPNAEMTVNSCRAVFVLNGITAGDLPNQARAFVLNFGDESTGIVNAEANSSLFTIHSSLNEWYTLDGRKLSSKPTTKGLYINNGKKIVIK